ncbi:MAG: nucleotidyl transferase AbiEii/AbiGii toxin family protein [Pseudonocardiales bacterium]
MLAVFDARHPAADADLLARHLPNDQETVVDKVRDVARYPLIDDGVDYLTETITVQTLREDADYAGVRITMDCRVSTAAVKLKLDVNVGDPVTPAPQLIELPSQRPGTPAVTVLGYPIETVLAEKTSTAAALGEANTRVRDYADLHTLTSRRTPPYASMRQALLTTAGYRGVALLPLSDVIGALPTTRQPAYDAFRRRLGPDGTHLPTDLAEVAADVIRFVDPLIDNKKSATTWIPITREWH